MMTKPNPFHPDLQELPRALPIFPLPGVILLPRAQLPLNVFEPRYLNMTLDALGNGRMIGMIQPDPSRFGPDDEAVYGTGCAGRITAFTETDDGRLLIVLTGVCRFEIGEELPLQRGYRRVVPRWERYQQDLDEAEPPRVAAGELLEAATRYLEAKGLTANLDDLSSLSPEDVVNALGMNLPFEPEEKQALLEAPTPAERAQAFLALAEMTASARGEPGETIH